MTAAGHVIFRRFWTTLAFGGAVGEWVLCCWFFGTPSSLLTHALCLAGLFAVNRLAAEAFDRETHRAPMMSPVGGVVLGIGFMAFGGAVALGVAAAGWLVLDMLIAFPAEAGALVGPAGAHLGPGFELVAPFIIAAAAGTVGYGYLVGHSRLRVTQVDVAIADLPPALDGLRVVQISDLHLGPLTHRASLREAFERVAALEPDVVCLTGDIVDSPKADLDHWGPEMGRLTARHGVFAILGNHDRVAGAEAVAATIARHTSWVLLRDAVASLVIDGARLHVIGLEDRLVPDVGRVLAPLLAQVPAGETSILLVHQPGAFHVTASSGIPLALAGHTHGGQVAAPGMPKLNPARLLMTRFDAGTFERDGAVLHVNRGLGVSGQRIRVGVPREITVVTLRARVATKAA